MKELISYINGQYLPFSEASLPVNDLGFQRGYGIFDFLRVEGKKPLYWEDHLDRFYHSAKEMRLPVGLNREALKEVIQTLIEKNVLPHSGIRIMLSGGASADGYTIQQPNLAIVQIPLPAPPDEMLLPGFKVVTYPHQRQMPQVKTTDYLMAIWLQPWVKEQGAADVLYRNGDMVSEFPRSNFFLVTNEEVIVTPADNVLHGITRKQIIQVARQSGYRVEERAVSMQEMATAKEAFMSSSTKRLIPIRQLDHIVFGPYGTSSVASRLFAFLRQHENTTV